MNYEELIKSSASRGGNNYSKSELNTLATVMMNDPAADITVHFKKGDTFFLPAGVGFVLPAGTEALLITA